MTEAVASATPASRPILWISTALGFAAGLPYSLLVGSVGVWLTNSGATFGAIGALSWIGLFYAFKFIWSPAFDWLAPPFLNTVGRRKGWMALCQGVIALSLFAMTLVDPTQNIALFAAFAVIAAFASSSQDIVIDAWRIETAKDPKQLDNITVRYQFGYRTAAIVGGAVALLLAEIWAVDQANERFVVDPGPVEGRYGALTLQAEGDFVYTLDAERAAAAIAAQHAAPSADPAFDADLLREEFNVPFSEGAARETMPLAFNIRAGDPVPRITPARPGPEVDGLTVTGDALLDMSDGWPAVWAIMAVLMALAIAASFAAPEPLLAPRPKSAAADDPEVRKLRRGAALPVAIGWAVSGVALLGFMFYTLIDPTANAAAWRDGATPFILLLTIGAPLGVSYWLAKKPGALEGESASRAFADVLFERVLAPLADIVKRYWLWALPILALAMTYRIADSIWGSFANPFYVAILQHSNSDVAVASKMVGVVMTLAGIAAGGLAIAWIGRMPALIIGAVLASLTNLLYADLALGGAGTQGFLESTGLLNVLNGALSGFVGAVQATGATVFDQVNLGDPLARLTAVIVMENLAGGFASAVHVVWLSSIVNKSYAAVQYALLASLALLIGVIFRPRLGAYVDEVKNAGIEAQAERFADIFHFAAWIGLLAIALAALEWWRISRAKTTPAS